VPRTATLRRPKRYARRYVIRIRLTRNCARGIDWRLVARSSSAGKVHPYRTLRRPVVRQQPTKRPVRPPADRNRNVTKVRNVNRAATNFEVKIVNGQLTIYSTLDFNMSNIWNCLKRHRVTSPSTQKGAAYGGTILPLPGKYILQAKVQLVKIYRTILDKLDFCLLSCIAGVATLLAPKSLLIVRPADLKVQLVQKCKTV
jgi:hypothetical protein